MDDSIKPISNQGFFSYVFKLSKFKQEDLLNIVQYSILSITPILIFIYFTKKYFPIATSDDSSLYIFIITFIELIFMITGIFFVDRIINYIPTYSGKYYETINLTNIVLIFMLIMLLIHGGFRERTSLLLHRFDDWFTLDDFIASKLGIQPKPFHMFDDGIESVLASDKQGKGSKKKSNGSNGSNTSASAASSQHTTNPQISQQYAVQAPLPTQGPSINQQLPNYNSMYANTSNPLVGAATPGMDDSFMEPEAANGALGGGSSWSSW